MIITSGEIMIPRVIRLLPGNHWGAKFVKSIPDFLDEEFGCFSSRDLDIRETYVSQYIWAKFLRKGMESVLIQDILGVLFNDDDPRILNQAHYNIIVCHMKSELENSLFSVYIKGRDPSEFQDIGREVIQAVRKIAVFS